MDFGLGFERIEFYNICQIFRVLFVYSIRPAQIAGLCSNTITNVLKLLDDVKWYSVGVHVLVGPSVKEFTEQHVVQNDEYDSD
jgi:hypothetical protein